MKKTVGSILLWICGAVLAVLLSLSFTPIAHVENTYIPVGNDSFYHARRILDAVRDPGAFYQVDPKAEAPEGSLISWPWAYDYFLARAVRLYMTISGESDAAKVLDFVPTVAVVGAIGLVTILVSLLELPLPLAICGVLFTAAIPRTRVLFGLGQVDHHWAEYFLGLLALVLGFAWLRRIASVRRAVAYGAVLGLSVGVHTGMFVLQLPLLAAIFVAWLRGESVPKRSALILAGTLVATTLAVSIPSKAFRLGLFDVVYLSWIQLYISVTTAAFIVLMAWLPRGLKSGWVLFGVAIAFLAPLLWQIGFLSRFIAHDIEPAAGIPETMSPWSCFGQTGCFAHVSGLYSEFFWISPLVLAGCIIALLRERDRALQLFWATCSIGLLGLELQVRFHPYGAFALYLPLLYWTAQAVRRFALQSRAVALAALAVFALVGARAVAAQLRTRIPRAMDVLYAIDFPVYPVLQDACKRRPGIVLALADAGHPIRYHTECSVIANAFRLTEQDARKQREVDSLLNLTPEGLAASRPDVAYVVVQLQGFGLIGPDALVPKDALAAFESVNPVLVRALLRKNAALDPRFKPLIQVDGGVSAEYSVTAAFEILPSPVQ